MFEDRAQRYLVFFRDEYLSAVSAQLKCKSIWNPCPVVQKSDAILPDKIEDVVQPFATAILSPQSSKDAFSFKTRRLFLAELPSSSLRSSKFYSNRCPVFPSRIKSPAISRASRTTLPARSTGRIFSARNGEGPLRDAATSLTTEETMA